MLLRDSLDAAVADVSADLHSLTTASRRQGLALRRRRRALSAVGSVAAVTVLAVGGYVLLPGSDGGATPVATDLPAPVEEVAPLSGATAPITGEGVAAALVAAVDEVADGTFSRFQGDATDHEGMASLLFRPANSTGPAGQVLINLQPAAMAGARPYVCDGYLSEYIVDCRVQRLPSGAVLRTYRQDDDTELGVGSQRVVAEVIRPDRRLRVIVFARNSNPWAGGELRDQAVLSTEQLTQIASQPWWSRTHLPAEYVRAGEALDVYDGED